MSSKHALPVYGKLECLHSVSPLFLMLICTPTCQLRKPISSSNTTTSQAFSVIRRTSSVKRKRLSSSTFALIEPSKFKLRNTTLRMTKTWTLNGSPPYAFLKWYVNWFDGKYQNTNKYQRLLLFRPNSYQLFPL